MGIRPLRMERAVGLAGAVVLCLCAVAPGARASIETPPVVPAVVQPVKEVLQPPRGCADADARAGTASGRRLASALACLIDAERQARRLPALRANTRLRRAAERHALAMLEHDFFGHRFNGLGVGPRVKLTGYARGARRWAVGEALHWGEGERSSPREALLEMLNSRDHRRILLARRMRDIGVAAVTYPRAGGRMAATYVVNVGRRS